MEENNGRIELLGFFKGTKKFFKTNIFIVAYNLVSPKKYFAKTLDVVLNKKFLGTQNSIFLAKYYFGLT